MRAAAIALLMMLVLGPRAAEADAIDDSIQELRSNAKTKDRVAAGVELARTGDPRAIAALADALVQDPDKLIRSVAAAGLGKAVTATSSAADQQLAIAVLGNASTQDPDAKVRRRAKKSLDKLLLIAAPPTGTYVDLGSMSTPRGHAGLSAHMGQVVGKLVNQQPGMQTASPATGFHLSATVTSISQRQVSTTSMTLSCKVQVVLADYPAKVSLAVVNGGASVVGAATGSQTAAATDCVDAVLEDILLKKLFPQITTQAAQAAAAPTSATTTTSSSTSTSTSP